LSSCYSLEGREEGLLSNEGMAREKWSSRRGWSCILQQDEPQTFVNGFLWVVVEQEE
jgi:hypothetical protein